MKTIVIYHRSDFDGIFCREIAKRFLGKNNVEYIGLEYGDELPKFSINDTLYILDFSVPEFMNHPSLIWIDHHKSAIEKFGPKKGYQIDGVAACRLAWQWFTIVDGNTNYGNVGNSIRAAGVLPMIQDYKDRTVDEPWAVRLAGEYDIWDKRDPNAELFQHGLRGSEIIWEDLLSNHCQYVESLLSQGKAIQFAKQKENESIINHQSFVLEWEGLVFLVCNHARFNSQLFDAAVDAETHDALLGFCWDGIKWKISMYHTPFNKEIDLSLIAIKYGGGGHKGACGFTCKELPFKLGQ